ncbi:MAG: SDR family NAD(P)-dependent oxidoreductase, partial [Saprospiraceae bacterium]
MHTSLQKQQFMNLLTNKVALVTGGSRGIGASIVEHFAAAGAHVAFTYHSSREKAEALAADVSQRHGVKVQAWQSDAADYAAAETLINDVLATFGQLDILV